MNTPAGPTVACPRCGGGPLIPTPLGTACDSCARIVGGRVAALLASEVTQRERLDDDDRDRETRTDDHGA